MTTILYFIMWIIITFFTAIFLEFNLIPYISRRYTFWKMSRQLKKMAKKYPGEAREKLNEIAELIKELGKNEKLIDDED